MICPDAFQQEGRGTYAWNLVPGSSDSADTTEGRTYRWKMAVSALPYNPFLLVYNILCFVMAFLQSPRRLHATTQQRKMTQWTSCLILTGTRERHEETEWRPITWEEGRGRGNARTTSIRQKLQPATSPNSLDAAGRGQPVPPVSSKLYLSADETERVFLQRHYLEVCFDL